jgi:TonB family protein
VTFWVAVTGRVERVEIAPEIEDRGFARRFLEVMRNYRFHPARSPDGAPVAGTTTVLVTF